MTGARRCVGLGPSAGSGPGAGPGPGRGVGGGHAGVGRGRRPGGRGPDPRRWRWPEAPRRCPGGRGAWGRSAPGRALSVDVTLAPSDPAGLAAFDQAVTTPGSPLYRHFLGPGQFRTRFGPAAGGRRRHPVLAGRRGPGPRAGRRATASSSPCRGRPPPSDGPSGSASTRTACPGDGSSGSPPARPRVPPVLAGRWPGWWVSTTWPGPGPRWPGRRRGPTTATGAVSAGGWRRPGPSRPGRAGCHEPGETATDLAQAYSMSSLYPADEGQGVTVGLYELEPYAPSDIATFESCYSPRPSPTITAVSVDGADPTAGPGSGEAALDIEMVVGLAPEAAIDVYVGSNVGVGPLDVYAAMIDDDAAQVLSTSWGECEAAAGTAEIEAEAALFQQAAAQGQSFLAAAGDEGSEDCTIPGVVENAALAVDDPASQPWVTAVGGTVLGSLGPPPSETVWNTGRLLGHDGRRELVGLDHALLAARTGRRERLHQRRRSLHRGVALSLERRGRHRLVPGGARRGRPTGPRAPASPPTAPAGPGAGSPSAAPRWGRPCGRRWPPWPTSRPGSRGGASDCSIPLSTRPAAWPRRPSTTSPAGTTSPSGPQPTDPPPAGGPDYPATRGYDLASGLGSPIASALLPDLVTPVDACPDVTAMDVRSGPAGGGTAVTLSGVNLGAVDEVDFGPGQPRGLRSVSATTVTVTSPPSPTGGWDTTPVLVKTATDALGYDGRFDFTFTGLRGYWTVASDGGVFAFGQLGFHGSLGGVHLDKPIVGMAPTPSSQGYWLVASDGGRLRLRRRRLPRIPGGGPLSTSPSWAWPPPPTVGATGWWPPTAASSPSATPASTDPWAAVHLDKPIVAMAATPDGRGYWLVASDGGVFAFGDARFHGSLGAVRPGQAHRGHGHHPRRRRLLAGGLRRRGLRLRRRPLRRLARGGPAGPAHRGHGHPLRGRGLLAGGLRRRRLRLRRRRFRRLHARPPPDRPGGGHGAAAEHR